MVVTKEEVLERLSRVLSIIPRKYIDALLVLHAKLVGSDVDWAVGGDLGEQLRTINVEPDRIEILTSRDSVPKIAEAVKNFNPSKLSFEVQKLSRDAKIEGKEYPAYVRSYYFNFNIGTIRVDVYGDIQYKIDSWDWGDKIEFIPEYVSLVGKQIAVVPLKLKYELYQQLGWTDRAEWIRQVMFRGRFRSR